MIRRFGFIALLLVLICSADLAYAQSNGSVGGVSVKEVGASVGTLLAAAMETAGYKAQQLVFEQLGSMVNGLAKLAFMVSIICAIAMTAMGGKYEKALWFILAPGVFLFLVNSKVTSAGAEWQFGTFKGQPGEVQAALNDPNSVNAKVSWAFDEFNQFISSVYQHMIKLITNEDMRQQMRFMARERVLDEMMSAELENPELTEFTKHVFSTCDKEMTAARQMALGNRDPVYKKSSEFAMARSFYKEKIDNPTKSVPEGESRNYLRTLLDTQVNAAEPASGPGIYQKCIDQTRSDIQARGGVENLLSAGVSCKQMWCWMALGIQNEVQHLQDQAIKNNVPKEGQNDKQLVDGIWQDITNKLTTPTNRSEFEQLAKNHVKPDLSLIPVIIGGHMLRKQMAQDPRMRGYSQMAEHSGVQVGMDSFNPRANAAQREELGRRLMEHQSSEAKRYELVAFAMMLPYIQGALLYGLALTFPFFTIMVLIPGKGSAMFQWMAFWAWAKSWDVGYAMVMVVDDILWSLMPHSSYYDPFKDPSDGPVSVFEAAFNGDPSYSLSMYYVLISMLLIAVPTITAEALLGTRKAVGGIFTNGLKTLSAAYGQTANVSAAIRQVHMLDRAREEGIARYTARRMATPASPAVKRFKAELDGWEMVGSALKGAGAAIGLLGAATAVAPALREGAGAARSTFAGTAGRAGIARRAGAAGAAGLRAFGNSALTMRGVIGAAAIVGGQTMTNTGFTINRRVNQGRSEMTRLNANEHFVNASRSDGWDTLNAGDTAASGRRFFRANTDAGNTRAVSQDLIMQEVYADILGSIGYGVGSGVKGVSDVMGRQELIP